MKKTPSFKSTSHYDSKGIFCTTYLQASPCGLTPWPSIYQYILTEKTVKNGALLYIWSVRKGTFCRPILPIQTGLEDTFPAPLRWSVHRHVHVYTLEWL